MTFFVHAAGNLEAFFVIILLYFLIKKVSRLRNYFYLIGPELRMRQNIEGLTGYPPGGDI